MDGREKEPNKKERKKTQKLLSKSQAVSHNIYCKVARCLSKLLLSRCVGGQCRCKREERVTKKKTQGIYFSLHFLPRVNAFSALCESLLGVRKL
jgi:hypothetical protein